MIFVDLGQGVKMCATDRSYFKVAIQDGGKVRYQTVRVKENKLLNADDLTALQKTVIKTNAMKAPEMLPAEERALMSARDGNPAPQYRDVSEKDIVTFFEENAGSDEKVVLTVTQLADLVARRSQGGDELLGEIAEGQEERDVLLNRIAELEGELANRDNIKVVKDGPVEAIGAVGGNAAGRVGEADSADAGAAAEVGTVRTKAPSRRKKKGAADGGNKGA